MIRFFLIFILIPCTSFAVCESGDYPRTGTGLTVTVTATTTSSVNSVYTWSFNSNGSPVNCGQFANGDYWIAPADGESTVTITALSGSDSVSLDADPIMETIGLLDGSNSYGNYTSAQNILSSLPATISTQTSLVAAIQRDEVATSNCGTLGTVGECADSYHVLTVLQSVPDSYGADTFRPNITGESKTLLTWDDFDLTAVPSLTYITGTDSAGIESIRQRWSHNTEIIGMKTDAQEAGYSEGGRAFRAAAIVDDYGGGMAKQFNTDLVTLFSDDNMLEEKKPALAAMLSFGFDIYNSVFNGPAAYDRFWGQGATQSAGKFLPAAFFAALSKNNEYMANIRAESSHLSEYTHKHGPHELGQVQWGTDARPLWGDDKFSVDATNESSYWGALFKQQYYDGATGTPVTPSNREGYDPYGYIDGPPGKPGLGYMASSLGGQRAMVGIMYMVPRVCQAVNYQRLVTYVDNLQTYGLQTADDPCVTPDSRESVDCTPYPSAENCTYYGVTWGPDGSGGCIETPTGSYTQQGRFASLDGDTVTPSYAVSQIESNWSTIRGTGYCYTGVAFEQAGTLNFTETGTLNFNQ